MATEASSVQAAMASGVKDRSELKGVFSLW